MIWTLPNMLTMLRVLAAPGVAMAFVVLDRPLADWVAFGLFVIAALTDFLDGWLARRLGQESAFGAMLDPIADKAMVIVALFTLAFAGFGSEWLFVVPAVVILMREVLVSGLREYLGAVKLAVTPLAKWKTTLQMVAIGGFLFLSPFHLAITEVAALPVAEAEAIRAGTAPDPLGYDLAVVVFPALEGWIVILLWLAAGLTLITGWDYFRKGLAYIREREVTR